jgi:hypothetical protein
MFREDTFHCDSCAAQLATVAEAIEHGTTHIPIGTK